MRDEKSVYGIQFQTELEVQEYTDRVLRFFCEGVTREKNIAPGMRVDVAGYLPDGRKVYVECKAFHYLQSCSRFVDAIAQAASYSDAVQWPVFVGPVFGPPSRFADGFGDALAGAHLVAGRFNVGFLWVDRDKQECGLMLCGQSMIRADKTGITMTASNLDNLFVYRKQVGSRKVSRCANV